MSSSYRNYNFSIPVAYAHVITTLPSPFPTTYAVYQPDEPDKIKLKVDIIQKDKLSIRGKSPYGPNRRY